MSRAGIGAGARWPRRPVVGSESCCCCFGLALRSEVPSSLPRACARETEPTPPPEPRRRSARADAAERLADGARNTVHEGAELLRGGRQHALQSGAETGKAGRFRRRRNAGGVFGRPAPSARAGCRRSSSAATACRRARRDRDPEQRGVLAERARDRLVVEAEPQAEQVAETVAVLGDAGPAGDEAEEPFQALLLIERVQERLELRRERCERRGGGPYLRQDRRALGPSRASWGDTWRASLRAPLASVTNVGSRSSVDASDGVVRSRSAAAGVSAVADCWSWPSELRSCERPPGAASTVAPSWVRAVLIEVRA